MLAGCSAEVVVSRCLLPNPFSLLHLAFDVLLMMMMMMIKKTFTKVWEKVPLEAHGCWQGARAALGH